MSRHGGRTLFAAVILTTFATAGASTWASAGGDQDGIAAVPAIPPGDGESGVVVPQQGLDFEFYRQNVEPVFLKPRDGYLGGETACVNCHTWQATTPLKLEPLMSDEGRLAWTEEQSRTNFEVVSRLVSPGNPRSSRLLIKALSPDAGGIGNNHTGGVFWDSTDDPEWEVLAEWVNTAEGESEPADRMVMPDFEFFRSCVQPIFVNPIENAIACTECHNGTDTRDFANPIPDGADTWSEEESRRSYSALMNLIEPGFPEYTRFLHHPLHRDAGGDFMHNGGRRWMTREDPEWQALAAWVRGEATGGTCPAALQF